MRVTKTLALCLLLSTYVPLTPAEAQMGTANNPMMTAPVGAGNIATAQIAAGTSAVQAVAARTNRVKVTFAVGGAVACTFGPSSVTTSNGFTLQAVAGASVTFDTQAAVSVVCASSVTVYVAEIY